MTRFVSLYDAETWLSLLVDRAAAGELRKPANAMCSRRIVTNFDAPDPAIERLFDANEV